MTYRSALFLLKVSGLVAILAVAPCRAQGQAPADVDGILTGSVEDGEVGGPLTGATIEVRTGRDSSLVTGGVTGDDGSFSITGIDAGTYFVRVGFVGYRSELIPEISFSAETPRVDLEEITLYSETTELDEVEVSAEREFITVGIDRTIYNVQNQAVDMGGSAQDMLENIPSVEVDINGNISLRGSQGVTVYLNGKPAPMSGEALTSFLQGLAAADIERVEVIPNPSAAFEPEGTSGILNIVLANKSGLGWGGGASASVNARGRYGGSVNAHYGGEDVNVYANYGLRYGEWNGGGWRFRENRYLDPLTFLRQDFSSERGGFSNTLNGTVDYDISENDALSFTAILSHRAREGDEVIRYEELDEDRELTDRYRRLEDSDNLDFGMDYRLDYKHTFAPREHELSIETRYEDDRDEELEQYVERELPLDEIDSEGTLRDRQDVNQDERERQFSFEADYVRPLGERFRAEVGYEADLEWVDSRMYSESLSGNDELTPDLGINNTFTYAEQEHSAYAVLSGNLGAFGAQLGLRMERALTNFNLRTTNENFRNSYFSVYPSVHLSYELTQGHTLKASYSKRVRRPSEWQLNPFSEYDDPTSRREGNPYLTPEYTHSGELGYTLLGRSYTISLSPYYRYSVDEISWHERITDDGVTILTFDNFDSEQSYGTELMGSLTLSDWLKGDASFNVYKQVTEAGDLSSELSNDALGFRSRISGTVEIMPGLRLQLSQRYRSPMDIPGGRISSRLRTDIALRQEWMSGRFSMGLEVEDVFDSTNNLIRRDMQRYYQEYYQERNDRNLQFSIRYTFSRRGGGDGDRGRGRRGGRDWR